MTVPAWPGPEDAGELIRDIACLPKRMAINQAMICPGWSRNYVAGPQKTL